MAKNQTNEETLPVAPQNDGAPDPDRFEKASGELGSGQIQKAVDEAEEKGYIGVKTDPRPNSDYSLEGGAPGTK